MSDNQHEAHRDRPIVSVHERSSDVTAQKCVQKEAGTRRVSRYFRRQRASTAVNGSALGRDTSEGKLFIFGAHELELSCVHAATNCVTLSETILPCAAGIKHA